MVLTEQELVLATFESKTDRRIRSALQTRRTTENFSEQAACDREIQRILLRKGTQAYKFNCCVVHQPWRFNQFPALPDHGWNEYGPTNEVINAVYRRLPIYSAPIQINSSIPRTEINNLNKRTNIGFSELTDNNNLVNSPQHDKPGWAVRLLGCIFA